MRKNSEKAAIAHKLVLEGYKGFWIACISLLVSNKSNPDGRLFNPFLFHHMLSLRFLVGNAGKVPRLCRNLSVQPKRPPLMFAFDIVG